MLLGQYQYISIVRGGSRISIEAGPNKGEGLHYEAMQYLLYLNAG